MALMNLDLPAIARRHPDLLAPGLLAQPVIHQLQALANAARGRAQQLHDDAEAGLAAMRGPVYVSLHAMSTTCQICAVLARRCAGELAAPAATMAVSRPASERYRIGVWYRLPSERQRLLVTNREVDAQVRAARHPQTATAAPQPEPMPA